MLLRGARYKLDAIGDYAYTFCVRVPPLKSLTQRHTTKLKRRLFLLGGSSVISTFTRTRSKFFERFLPQNRF